MFWQTELAAETSTDLSLLLEKEDTTLEMVLDDEFMLQEMKGDNRKLIDFLTKEDSLKRLVEYALVEPADDPNIDDSKKYRFSHLSCEVLTTNIAEVSEALVASEHCMSVLLNFLDRNTADRPLNPLLASFYERIVVQLLYKVPRAMITAIKTKKEFIPNLLSNLNNCSVMDLLYRLITVPQEEKDREELQRWLVENHLVDSLAAKFPMSDLCDAGDDAVEDVIETTSNAGHLWAEMIKILRDTLSAADDRNVPNVLLDALQSKAALSNLLQRMFASKCEEVLAHGCSVFHSLLTSFNIPDSPAELAQRASDPDRSNWVGGTPRQTAVADDELTPTSALQRDADLALAGADWTPDKAHNVERALATHIGDFRDVLLRRLDAEPTLTADDNPLITCTGVVKEPLGVGRLAIVKLISYLLNTNHVQAHEAIAKEGVLKGILDMTLRLDRCSLLHNSCLCCVSFVLFSRLKRRNADEVVVNYASPLIRNLLVDCRLVDLIFANTELIEATPRLELRRPGNHGHIMRMAQLLQFARLRGPNKEKINELLKELNLLERWEEYVEKTLIAYEKENEAEAVDVPQRRAMFMDDVEAPGSDTALVTANQAFSDFKMQQVAASIPENFGLPMDTFTKKEGDGIEAMMPKSEDFDFDVAAQIEEDYPSGEAEFEKLCESRLGGGDFMGNPALLPDKALIFPPTTSGVADEEEIDEDWPGDDSPSMDRKKSTFSSELNSRKQSVDAENLQAMNFDDWPGETSPQTHKMSGVKAPSLITPPSMLPPQTTDGGNDWAASFGAGANDDWASFGRASTPTTPSMLNDLSTWATGVDAVLPFAQGIAVATSAAMLGSPLSPRQSPALPTSISPSPKSPRAMVVTLPTEQSGDASR